MPGRISVDHVLEEARAEGMHVMVPRRWPREDVAPPPSSRLARGRIYRKNQLVAGIMQPAIDLLDRGHLLRGQAATCFLSCAQQNRRIEAALARVLDHPFRHPLRHAIRLVTGRECSVLDGWQ